MVKKSKKYTQQPPFRTLAKATILALVAYGALLLAIDSGSLFQYLVGFVGIYYSVHFFKQFVKLQFFNNEKTRKTR